MIKPASFPKTFWLYGVGFLASLYIAAFLLVYNPWGRTFGFAFPVELLYLKIVLVTLTCFWLIRRVYYVISKAGEVYEGPHRYVRSAKVFVIAAASVLFVATPLLALMLDVSYR